MLKKIQEQLTTAEKFYDAFYKTPEGKLAYTEGYKLFPTYNNDNEDTDDFIDFILDQMQDWLYNTLTDDEMDSAYTWFENMSDELHEMIHAGLT